jgi:hypothetical protein
MAARREGLLGGFAMHVRRGHIDQSEIMYT